MSGQAFYGVPPPDEERFRLLDLAHESGCIHWDSAALYGDSEELLGKWFQRTGKRKEVRLLRDLMSTLCWSLSQGPVTLTSTTASIQIFLTTKFGNHVTPDGGREIRNDPEYIRQSVAQSLERLKTDYIDLLYCHRFSGKTPVEDIVETMKEFVE